MKTKLLLTTLFGVAAWSLSSLAMANWNTGACPGGGTAPCIETEINGNTYHFNGSGGHAGVWHGRPAAEGGGEFTFSDDSVVLDCNPPTIDCNLSLSGEVKKCQDSDGQWRIGVRVTGASTSGSFLCDALNISGFPWYSKDPTIASHCPFEDNCDTFIPYDPSATTYTANFGDITVSSLLGTYVQDEHVEGVIFTPGVGATFDFSNKTFYSCDEEAGCTIDGILTLDNATSLDVY